jgi:hypothetical protein
MGRKTRVLCHQKIKENIDLEWGWWTRGEEKRN